MGRVRGWATPRTVRGVAAGATGLALGSWMVCLLLRARDELSRAGVATATGAGSRGWRSCGAREPGRAEKNSGTQSNAGRQKRLVEGGSWRLEKDFAGARTKRRGAFARNSRYGARASPESDRKREVVECDRNTVRGRRLFYHLALLAALVPVLATPREPLADRHDHPRPATTFRYSSASRAPPLRRPPPRSPPRRLPAQHLFRVRPPSPLPRDIRLIVRPPRSDRFLLSYFTAHRSVRVRPSLCTRSRTPAP